MLKAGASLKRQISKWGKCEGGDTDSFKKTKKGYREYLEGKKKPLIETTNLRKLLSCNIELI